MAQYDARPGQGLASAVTDMAFRRVRPAECDDARAALASCGRDDWCAGPEGYPGCMLAEDIAAGRAWGLFDGQGLAAYGVLALEPQGEGAVSGRGRRDVRVSVLKWREGVVCELHFAWQPQFHRFWPVGG